MYEIEKTAEFNSWLTGLQDSKAQKVIAKRIQVMSTGTLGETRTLGDGLFEAKIRYGPGFRLYFVK